MSPETTYISVEGDNPGFQPRLCTLNVSGPSCSLRSRELPVSVPGSPLTPASLDIRGLSVHHCDHLPVILKAVTPSTLGLRGGRCTGPGEHGHSNACARMPPSPNDVPYPGPNQEPTRAETGCPVVNAEATNSLRQRSGPAPSGQPRDLTRTLHAYLHGTRVPICPAAGGQQQGSGLKSEPCHVHRPATGGGGTSRPEAPVLSGRE